MGRKKGIGGSWDWLYEVNTIEPEVKAVAGSVDVRS